MPHQLATDDSMTCRQCATGFNTGAWHARSATLYDLPGAPTFLTRDHKWVGGQEVLLDDEETAILFPFHISLPSRQAATSNLRLKWHQGRIHGAHLEMNLRPCFLAQSQTSAGCECPQKTRLLASLRFFQLQRRPVFAHSLPPTHAASTSHRKFSPYQRGWLLCTNTILQVGHRNAGVPFYHAGLHLSFWDQPFLGHCVGGFGGPWERELLYVRVCPHSVSILIVLRFRYKTMTERQNVVPVLNSLFKQGTTIGLQKLIALCVYPEKATEEGGVRDRGRAKKWGNGY